MKRPVDIKSTFEAIRKLPLEITFNQVEKWICSQEIKPLKENRWMNLFLAKYFYRSKN